MMKRRWSKRQLTHRQQQVLMCLAAGYTLKGTALELEITHATVCNHVRNIYDKLDAVNEASAVATAMRLGMIR